jgi:hypothetical protein
MVMLAGVLVLRASAQWNVPDRIILDGSTPADRQVHGLAAPQSGTDGASAATDRHSTAAFATATGVDALSIALSPAPIALTPGLRIVLLPTAVNTGAVTIQVNGLPVADVHKLLDQPLDSADLRPGLPLELVYDGAVFQVASQVHPGCPPGYKALGRTACVEAVSREPLNWYAANVACANEGKRLCGFSEWMQACLQNDNIFGTVVDYEWVDEAANSTNLAKLMGVNETTLLPDCKSGGHRVPTSTQRFRCCYDR